MQNSSLAVTFGLLNAFTALQPESLKVTVTDFFHHVNSITALREAWSFSSCTSRCLQTFSLVKRGSWKPPHRQVPAQMIFPSTEFLYTPVQATCESLQRRIFRQFLVFGVMESCGIWNASSHLQSEIKLVEWKKPNSVAPCFKLGMLFRKIFFGAVYLISVLVLNVIHIRSFTD